MQTNETITVPAEQWELIPAGQVTAESINAKARELGQAGSRLLQAGKEMVALAITLGGMLEEQADRVFRAGGSWQDWQEANLDFSPQSAGNYRRLFRKRELIASALERGVINSIRQALRLLEREPGFEVTPLLPGMDAEDDEPVTPRSEELFKSIWRIFREPEKAPVEERRAFIQHTSHAVRICRAQGWELEE